MECAFPTLNASSEEERAVFEKSRVLAIIGLSPDETKDSHRVALYLQGAGFSICPVYPKEEVILGEKVWRALDEIDGPVDAVIVFRKADAVPEIFEQIKKRSDVKALWLQIGIVHNDVAQKAKELGLTVVQSRCAMVEHRRLYGGEGV